MEKNNQVEQKYAELQGLQQKLNQLQQQISIFNSQVTDFRKLNQDLKDLKEVKANTETLSSIGAGIFVKSELKDSKKVIMNVGANTFVTKSIDEATNLVEKQIQEIEKIQKECELSFQETIIHAQKLEQEVMALTAKNK